MNNVSYEQLQLLSINSHKRILHLKVTTLNLNEGLCSLHALLEKTHINDIQILASAYDNNDSKIMLTGPSEQLDKLTDEQLALSGFSFISPESSSVTLTYTSPISLNITNDVTQFLTKNSYIVTKVLLMGCNLTFIVNTDDRKQIISLLHTQLLEGSFESHS